MTSRRLAISRAATLITIVVMAWQVDLPLNLPQFDTAKLPLSYLAPAVGLAEITALIAIVAYALAGWPNFAAVRSGWRGVFALALIGLVLFEALSIAWSIQRGLAAVQVLHVAVWAAFALLITCADWPAATMAFALLLGLLLHSFIGFIQISLQPLVQITPQNSGISVVFNAAQHLQRVYGLSPHPNLLGGHLAIGVILIFGLMIAQQHTKRSLGPSGFSGIIAKLPEQRHCEERPERSGIFSPRSRRMRRSNPVGGHGRLLRFARNDGGSTTTRQSQKSRSLLIAAWLAIWVALLLTFSRSAWLAMIGGGLIALLLLKRGGQLDRSLIKLLLVLSGVGLGVVSAFALGFQPFLANRLDVTTTSYETQAITERMSAARLALQIFAAHPLTGVGISQSVVATRDLLGAPIDWVHNVPLLAAAELGAGGILLIALLMIALGAVAVQRWRARTISVWQALVGGGLIALIIVMQFDHYVWTAPQGGLLWAWLVGWWMRADHMTAS